MGAKPVLCWNQICAINDCVIMRLQCNKNQESDSPMFKSSQIQQFNADISHSPENRVLARGDGDSVFCCH